MLQPLVMGHQVRVPTAMILVSFLVMGSLLGPIVGALLAVPTAVLMSALLEEHAEDRPPFGAGGSKEDRRATTVVEAAGRHPELAASLGTSEPAILTLALPSVYGDPRKANWVVKDCEGLEKQAVGRWFARTTKGWRPPAGLRAKTDVRPARRRRPGRPELRSGPRSPNPSEPRDEPGRRQKP